MRCNSTDPIVTTLLLDEGEYDFVRPNMEHKTILDGGANCGIASVIFALMWVMSHPIICRDIEPTLEKRKDNNNMSVNSTIIFST